MALEKKVELYYSTAMMAECNLVFYRSKFNFRYEALNRLLSGIADNGHLIFPSPSMFEMPDENDRICFDTAKASGSYLISGNTKHYPAEPFIATPTKFLDLKASMI